MRSAKQGSYLFICLSPTSKLSIYGKRNEPRGLFSSAAIAWLLATERLLAGYFVCQQKTTTN